MLSSDFFKKWYQTFAQDVDKYIMQEHVKASGCMPWHIFTWGKVEATSGKPALNKFLKMKDNQPVYVFMGFDYEDDWVEEYDFMDKTELIANMKNGKEVFITAQDFSWTFVWTHEGYYCGPYLCIKK